MIPATYQFRNKGLAVMTSRSFDGEYIARIIQKLGFTAVRGSSSRGAVGALFGMREQIGAGPRRGLYHRRAARTTLRRQAGAGLLAKKTGVPI